MIRAFIEDGALFLVPFAAFALLLLLQRRRVLHPEAWTGPAAWLAVAGLVLVIGVTVGSALFGERHTGPYVPPHIGEDGEPVPGHFE